MNMFQRLILSIIGPLPGSGKRFGKYRGTVIENKDPEKRGRIHIRLPSLPSQSEALWAEPCLPLSGPSPSPLPRLPTVGSSVWIEFEQGDARKPLWVGIIHPAAQYPDVQETVPESPSVSEPNCCQYVECFDSPGKEYLRLFHPRGSEIVLEPNGSILLKDAAENYFRLDAENNIITIEDSNGNNIVQSVGGTQIQDSNGNTLSMDSEGITVEAPEIILKSSQVRLGGSGGEKVLLGESFLNLFATHIHTSAPVVGGPSSPPIPQGETTSLSSQVKSN